MSNYLFRNPIVSTVVKPEFSTWDFRNSSVAVTPRLDAYFAITVSSEGCKNFANQIPYYLDWTSCLFKLVNVCECVVM